MKVDIKENDKELVISLEGRLDTNTSSDLEKEVSNLNKVHNLIFDFTNLEFISSSGLRLLLVCQKRMVKQGKMIIRNVNENIKSVLDMTGFSDLFTIEDSNERKM